MACNNSRWKAANQSKYWRRRRRRIYYELEENNIYRD